MKKLFTMTSVLVLLMMLSSCATVTPLGRAAKQGDMKKVEDLLNKGADVNVVMVPGLSPLHEAVFNNAPIDIVRLLLDKGADVNKVSCGDGWDGDSCGTPLSIAVFKGNINMVKLLVAGGADVNAMGRWGDSPLSLAAENAHTDIMNILIEKGADIDRAIMGLEQKITYVNAQAGVRCRSGIKFLERMAKRQMPGNQMMAAVSTTGSPSTPLIRSDIDSIPSTKAELNKNAYAIVIGIETYRQKLPKADFAMADARTVREYLIKVMGYPEENVVSLTNEYATKSDFEKYFERWLSNNAEKTSTIFIYFSGHGAPNPKTGDAYLVPYDGDPAFIDQTGYSLKRLYDALGRLKAKEIIVALDSCFSGAGGRSVIAKGARPLVMNLQSSMVLSKNMTVLSASSGDQISSTYDQKGHGLFTYFLLKGIKNEDVVNPDGSIKMEDLFGYVKPQVERIARKQYNNEQTPQLIFSKD